MWTIRGRFDVIETLKHSDADPFSRAEAAAFHGRKILEGIAFACLVAIENGISHVPRDAKGQWNAELIFKSLKSKGLNVLPSPSILRQATDEERRQHNVNITSEGIPDRRLTHEELIEIYQDLHSWLHEINPYVFQEHSTFYEKNAERLWINLGRVHSFVERHQISIHGAALYCVLCDKEDKQTKVVPLAKEQV